MEIKKVITDEQFNDEIENAIREALDIFLEGREPLEPDQYREHLYHYSIHEVFDEYTHHSVISKAELEYGEPLRDVANTAYDYDTILPSIHSNVIEDYLENWFRDHHYITYLAQELHNTFDELCDDPNGELNTPEKILQHFNKYITDCRQSDHYPIDPIDYETFNSLTIRGVKPLNICDDNLMDALEDWAFEHDFIDPQTLPDPNSTH